jgi:hypothetical protein
MGSRNILCFRPKRLMLAMVKCGISDTEVSYCESQFLTIVFPSGVNTDSG